MKYALTVCPGVRLCNACDPHRRRLLDPSETVEYIRGEDYEVDEVGALTALAGGGLRLGNRVTVICEAAE